MESSIDHDDLFYCENLETWTEFPKFADDISYEFS